MTEFYKQQEITAEKACECGHIVDVSDSVCTWCGRSCTGEEEASLPPTDSGLKTVFTYGGANLLPQAKTAEIITMEQHESPGRRFRVTYGLQVKDRLTYAQAASELGSCIMHFLACESVLCNDSD